MSDENEGEAETTEIEERAPVEKSKRGLKPGTKRARESHGLPSLLLDREYPEIPEEVAVELRGEEEETQVPELKVDKVFLKGLIGINNTMKILKFLYDRNNAFYVNEISRGLGMWYGTVSPNLVKLEKLGLVVRKKFKADQIRTYYEIPEYARKAAKLAIILWKQRISFKLAHYIPDNKKITAEELMKDERFVKDCHKKYTMSLEEGIDCVLTYAKRTVDSERTKGVLWLWRKIQGYRPQAPWEKAIEIEEFIE